jgi:pimeloyl-ACP methyl ester carboxylesterase
MGFTTVASNGIEIAYETCGAPGGRPLLLVVRLGAQMLAWHPELCAALVAEDFFVVRYDNRDVGLSIHLHHAQPPNLDAAMAGDFSSAAYRLEDMADDAVGLLDALGLDQAHVVGVSLSGMIAQTMAIRHPGRVRSLASIMSTPWAGHLRLRRSHRGTSSRDGANPGNTRRSRSASSLIDARSSELGLKCDPGPSVGGRDGRRSSP